MASAWQTMEEAALTLGISSRTLHRRLARGEFETRMENGRREVLVVIAEPQIGAIPEPPPTTDMADTPGIDMSDTSAGFESPSDGLSERSDMSADLPAE